LTKPHIRETAVHTLWPVLVLERYFSGADAFNAELVQTAKRAVEATGVSSGPYYFTKRRYNIFSSERGPAIRQLGRMVCEAVRDLLKEGYKEDQSHKISLSGWPMWQTDETAVGAHHHAGNHFSAVYYAQVDPPRAGYEQGIGGSLSLLDPRPANRNFELAGARRYHERKTRSFAVKSGMLIIFPAYVVHHVPTYFSDGVRVAFAVNINLQHPTLTETFVDEDDLAP